MKHPPIGTTFAAKFPPAVGYVITDAIRKIEAGRIPGCVHLEREPIGIVCWPHPTMVRCHTCSQGHVKAHSDLDEHGCNICGQHMPIAASALLALIQPVEVDALVPVGRGRVAAVGQVVFVGWGACVECFEVEQ